MTVQRARSKYAFLPVDAKEVAGKRIDFPDAQQCLAKLLPAEWVRTHYNRSRRKGLSVKSPPDGYRETWPAFNKLELPQTAVETWRCAGAALIEALALGLCHAYAADPTSATICLIPEEYWKADGLVSPHDSRLAVLDTSWGTDQRFHGQAIFFIEAQVMQLTKTSLPRKGGRPPKYGWAQFEAKLTEELKERGLPMQGEGGWQSKDDVIDFMLEWCGINWKESPGNTQAKEHVYAVIERFKNEAILGGNPFPTISDQSG